MDQTDTEKRADLFRVHLLRRRGLMTEVAPKRTLRPKHVKLTTLAACAAIQSTVVSRAEPNQGCNQLGQGFQLLA